MEELKIKSIHKLKNINLPGKTDIQSYAYNHNNKVINFNYLDNTNTLNIIYNKSLIPFLSGGSIQTPQTWIGFIITFNQSNSNIEYDNDNSVGEWAINYSIDPSEKTDANIFNDEVEADNSIIVWINSTDNITMAFKNENNNILLNVNFVDNIVTDEVSLGNGFYEFTDEEWKKLETVVISDNIQICNTYLAENDYTNEDAYKLAKKDISQCTDDKTIQVGDFLESTDISYYTNKIYIDRNIDMVQCLAYIENIGEDTSDILIYKSFHRYSKYNLYTNTVSETTCSLKKVGEDYKIVLKVSYRANDKLIVSKEFILYENKNWIEENCKLLEGDVLLTFKKDGPNTVFYNEDEIELAIKYYNGIITYTSGTVLDDIFYVKPYIINDIKKGLYNSYNEPISYNSVDIIDDLPYTNISKGDIYNVNNIADSTPLTIKGIYTVKEDCTDDDKLNFNNKHIKLSTESFSLTDNTYKINIEELKETKYSTDENLNKNKYINLIIDFGIYNRLIEKIDYNLIKVNGLYRYSKPAIDFEMYNKTKDIQKYIPDDFNSDPNTCIVLKINISDVSEIYDEILLKKINNESPILNIGFTLTEYSPTEDQEAIDDEEKVLLHLANSYKDALKEGVEAKYYLLNDIVRIYVHHNDSEDPFYYYDETLKYTPYALTEDKIKETLNTVFEPVSINKDLADTEIYILMKVFKELNPDEEFGLLPEDDFIWRLKNIYCNTVDDIIYNINEDGSITIYSYINKDNNIITYGYIVDPKIWNMTADRIAVILRKYNVRKVIIGKRISLFSNEISDQYFNNSKSIYYKQLRNKIALYELTTDNVDKINYETDLNLLLLIIPEEWDSTVEEMIEILNEKGAIKIEEDII